MTYRRLLVTTLICAMLVAGAPISAASPALPGTDPSDCTIEPRTRLLLGEAGDLAALSPTPTPVIDEAGAVPADDAVIAAVTATAAMAIACQNAGDLPRMLASFSDAWILGRFDSYDLVFVDSYLDDTALPATPLAVDDQRALLAITDVVELPDGAVVATVVTTAGGIEERSRLRFVEENGALVIDEAVVLP